MKRKFITHYTMIEPKSGDEWLGTCKKWYEDSLYFGLTLKRKEQILWLGKKPVCHLCIFGGHVKPKMLQKGRA